ncbi:MAG TPA: hypothetical protein VFS20_06220 [Longimicrobium sp.]|nr:hypothetical protein [Longimicrobium sp.]
MRLARVDCGCGDACQRPDWLFTFVVGRDAGAAQLGFRPAGAPAPAVEPEPEVTAGV